MSVRSNTMATTNMGSKCTVDVRSALSMKELGVAGGIYAIEIGLSMATPCSGSDNYVSVYASSSESISLGVVDAGDERGASFLLGHHPVLPLNSP